MKKRSIGRVVGVLVICIVVLVACGGGTKGVEKVFQTNVKPDMMESEAINQLGEPDFMEEGYQHDKWDDVKIEVNGHRYSGNLDIYGSFSGDRVGDFSIGTITWGMQPETKDAFDGANEILLGYVKELYGDPYEENVTGSTGIYKFKVGDNEITYMTSYVEHGTTQITISVT